MKGIEFAHVLARRLIDLQNADGGWAASGAGGSATEPTSWALRALESIARDPELETALSAAREPGGNASMAESRRKAIAWLTTRQFASGSWPISDEVAESGASTAIAALALADCPEPELGERAIDGVEWLLEHRGNRVPWYLNLYWRWKPEVRPWEYDLGIRGWSWAPGLWGFIEPTSIAVILLKTMETRLARLSVREAIDEGEAFLVDRSCPTGGWNYGIGRSHEEDLWPYPDTTAFALLALGPERPDEAVAEGLVALHRMLECPVSRLTTALGILTFERFGLDAEELRHRLVEEWADPFPPPTTRTLALSLMAARGDRIGAAGRTGSASERAGHG